MSLGADTQVRTIRVHQPYCVAAQCTVEARIASLVKWLLRGFLFESKPPSAMRLSAGNVRRIAARAKLAMYTG